MAGRITNYLDIPTNSEYGEVLEFRDWIVVILDLITRLKGTDTPFDQNSCTIKDIIGVGEITDKFCSLIELGDKVYSLEQFKTFCENKLSDIDKQIVGINSNISNLQQSVSNIEKTLSDHSLTINTIQQTIQTIQSTIDTLNRQVSTNTQQITNLSESLKTTNNNLTSLMDKVQKLEGQNLNQNITALKNDMSNVKTRLEELEQWRRNLKLDAGTLGFIQNSQNAKKVICSTSQPPSQDSNPNGTIWFVYR